MVKRTPLLWLMLIQWVIALEWLQSGWGKYAKPDFMEGLEKTLGFFAAKHPDDGIAQLLKEVAIPNAELFGNLVRMGEVAVGVTLLIAGWLALTRGSRGWIRWSLAGALVVGILLNATFYLAGGHTSPSSSGINLVMGLVQAVLLAYYLSDYADAPAKRPVKKK